MPVLNNTNYTDRDGIVDAVTRMLEGIDFADEDLLRSALTEDAVFDVSGLDPSVGEFEPYVGRDEAVRKLMDTVGLHMDTFHAMSNVRIEVSRDTASMTCYLIGQHFLLGQGASVEFEDYLLLGNRLEVNLVRDHDHEWLVRRNRATSRKMFSNAIELLDGPATSISIPYEGTELPGYLFWSTTSRCRVPR